MECYNEIWIPVLDDKYEVCEVSSGQPLLGYVAKKESVVVLTRAEWEGYKLSTQNILQQSIDNLTERDREREVCQHRVGELESVIRNQRQAIEEY